MTDEPAQYWRRTLREALLAARKDRDATRIAALRSALGAIDKLSRDAHWDSDARQYRSRRAGERKDRR